MTPANSRRNSLHRDDAQADSSLAAVRRTLRQMRALLDEAARPEGMHSSGEIDPFRHAKGAEIISLIDRLRADLTLMKIGAGSLDNWKSVPLPAPNRIAHPSTGTSKASGAAGLSAGELLEFDDALFVENAYRTLLRREVDPGGLAHFLTALRSGKMSKEVILTTLTDSEEGVRTRAVVPGLHRIVRWDRLRRKRVTGYFAGVFIDFLRLWTLPARLQRLESSHFRRGADLAHNADHLLAATARLNALAAADDERKENVRGLVRNLTELSESLESVRAELATRARAADLQAFGFAALSALNQLEAVAGVESEKIREELARLGAASLEERARVDELSASANRLGTEARAQFGEIAIALQNAGAQIIDLTSGLHGFAAEARGRIGTLDDSAQDRDRKLAGIMARRRIDSPEQARLLDAMYADFEARFRGSPEEIKERMAVYLPYIQMCPAVTASTPLLDIGCGRGEWLEVLRDAVIPARGVDMNSVTADDCKRRGLEVVEANALDHLSVQGDSTLGAISAIHVVEHLSFEELLALLEQALRVLRPGGVLIFETPNPENLIVGACAFWTDPTHLRPLPPEALRFIVEARGFSGAEITRLHPFPPSTHLAGGESAAQLNQLLYGPRDYAVIGRKPT